ncbi:hypothetical protein CO173_03645 [Candidatus Uhrbacteria bacterium CG_4_9_14_3_um_filter_41_35]|uniref:Uncharacterized protein n=1 Tax=Candidatus Uhrbacteria bacterium CG_4_9_14_3_um_filter_41_35 TaxID=1975034 RepID=A0A2M7XE06_9BACT|nr:MAG: hypothetical protein COV92_02105 [Candidatus Uhrbacteria bacterium CG11_big_fil_rev_8_21_14_0_20_41_9]PJA46107.1 MAG: hypothetical protein CO173_03645 [Candidatus Uhrbacteria bacterium CG_4_9_14_3_um_filter_41_35]
MGDGVIEKVNLLASIFSNVDILIALLVVVGAVIFAYTIGKDFIITSIFALYMAIGTMALVPILDQLSFGLDTAFNKIILLSALTVIFLYLQTKNGFFEPIVVPNSWESAVFAVTWAGMFIMAVVSFLTPEMQSGLSSTLQLLFVDQPFANTWYILPITTLVFIRGNA